MPLYYRYTITRYNIPIFLDSPCLYPTHILIPHFIINSSESFKIIWNYVD